MRSEKTLSAFWKRRSLRFWLVTGMAMSLLPIFVLTVAGYVLHHRTIIQPLVEVASKQRRILQPMLGIQLSLWGVSKSVVDFSIDGDVQYKESYLNNAGRIESAFADLTAGIREHSLEIPHVSEAQSDWADLVLVSHSLLLAQSFGSDAAPVAEMEKFEDLLERLGGHLAMAFDAVRIDNERTHNQALVDLRNSEYFTLIGFVVSILGAILGVTLINRSLVSSMDQLAAGAVRFASGDREHSISVQIPRELSNVADAFNFMTRRIREQEEALTRAARTDGLTGLFNRREFDRIVADEIRRTQRYGGSVSLILADIDHFKRFNDTYGHQAGDEALRTVSQVLERGLRDTDRACRFGGEELAIVLPESDVDAARQAAERVRAAVETTVVELQEGRSARVTISVGVATFPGDGTTPEALLKSADSALYRSKELGRNRVTTAA